MRVSFAGTKLHKVFVERNKYVEQEYHNYIQVNSKMESVTEVWNGYF